MSDEEAAAYCLARARERINGPAGGYWLAIVRACERILERTQENRG